MPIIEVHLLEGRSVAQKRAMISEITQAVVRALGVNPESVRILIDEMQAEHFAVGGLSAGERPLNKRNGHDPNHTNGHAAENAQ
jgi:4-oxalocrotonate tautomerase